MTKGRQSDRDQQVPGRQIPSPEVSMAVGLGEAECNGAGSVQPLEDCQGPQSRALARAPPALLLASTAVSTCAPSPWPVSHTWPNLKLPHSLRGHTLWYRKAPGMTPEAPPGDAKEMVFESFPSSLTPGAPGDAREGTGHHVLLAVTILRKGGEAEGKTPADQGVSHARVSSLPPDAPGRLKTSRS